MNLSSYPGKFYFPAPGICYPSPPSPSHPLTPYFFPHSLRRVGLYSPYGFRFATPTARRGRRPHSQFDSAELVEGHLLHLPVPQFRYFPAPGRTTDQSRVRCSGTVGAAAPVQGDCRKIVHLKSNRQITPTEHLREAQRQQAP